VRGAAGEGRGAIGGGGGGGGGPCSVGAGAWTSAGSGGGSGPGAASQSWFAVSLGVRMPQPLAPSGLAAGRSVVWVSSAIENEANRAPQLASIGAARSLQPRFGVDQAGGAAAGGEGAGAGGAPLGAEGVNDTVGAARSESAAAKKAKGWKPMMRP
jgi:hypothetical protein